MSELPAVFPKWFDRLQVKYFNPVIRPLAGKVPGLALIEHRGRKTQRPYRTPVTAFRKGNLVAIVLGHGRTDWVRNVLAAGEADLQVGRRTLHLVNPRIVPAGGDPTGLPRMARLQVGRVAIFVADVSPADPA